MMAKGVDYLVGRGVARHYNGAHIRLHLQRAFEQLDAVHARHHYVGQQYVYGFSFYHVERSRAFAYVYDPKSLFRHRF